MLQAKHSEEMEAKDELIAQIQQELAESQVSVYYGVSCQEKEMIRYKMGF